MTLPGMDSLPIPIEAQIACVKREIELRSRVYPRWTATGKLKPATADSEIAAMRAVLATLERVKREADDGR